MPAIELSDAEWQAVVGIIATAPWRDANPLLLKIGEQLRRQEGAQALPSAAGIPPRRPPVPVP